MQKRQLLNGLPVSQVEYKVEYPLYKLRLQRINMQSPYLNDGTSHVYPLSINLML